MKIDSHCHFQYAPLSIDDLKECIEVEKFSHLLCVATSIADYKTMISYKKLYPAKVSISLGEHPLNELKSANWELMEQLIQESQIKIDAIGEIGFDFKGDLKLQNEAFEKQAQMAINYNLPVILHTREVETETMAAIRNFPKLKGVFHCFTGSRRLAEFAIANNWYISFSGIITYHNAGMLKEILKIVPKELLLIETDAPYLAPVPMRRKINHPKYIQYIAEFIADQLDMPVYELFRIMRTNLGLLLNKEIIM